MALGSFRVVDLLPEPRCLFVDHRRPVQRSGDVLVRDL
jgi:hypothetical protein